MRTLIAAVSVGLLISTAALARDRPPTPAAAPPLHERVEQLLEGLDLTAEQHRQVERALGDTRQALAELRAEAEDLLPRERLARTGQIMRELRDEVMAALDESQRQELRDRIEEFQERWRPGGPGSERLREQIVQRLREAAGQLDLTPEQQQEVYEILGAAQEQMQEMRRQIEIDVRDGQEQVRRLLEQTRRELNDTLTPEQQERFRQLMPRERPRQ